MGVTYGHPGLSVAVPAGFFIGPRSPTLSRTVNTVNTKLGSWLVIEASSQAVDQAVWEVATTGGDAASVLTLGLYRLRSPGSLTVDLVLKSAAVDAVALAIKSTAFVTTLTRGLYVAVLEATGHSAQAPFVRGTNGSIAPYSDLTDLTTDPRGGLGNGALVNAAGLPAAFSMVAGTARSHGPIVGLRAA